MNNFSILSELFKDLETNYKKYFDFIYNLPNESNRQ